MRKQPIMQSTPRAVLWDMDGTLLDSAEYHWLAWRETLAAERYDLTRDQFVATFGQRNDTILRGWLGADLSLDEIERIGGTKEACYRELSARFLAITSTMGEELTEEEIRKAIEIVRQLSEEVKGRFS